MAGRRISGNMSTMSTIMYFKNPRGGQKNRGARAPLEPPRTAPLKIKNRDEKKVFIFFKKAEKRELIGFFLFHEI